MKLTTYIALAAALLAALLIAFAWGRASADRAGELAQLVRERDAWHAEAIQAADSLLQNELAHVETLANLGACEAALAMCNLRLREASASLLHARNEPPRFHVTPRRAGAWAWSHAGTQKRW